MVLTGGVSVLVAGRDFSILKKMRIKKKEFLSRIFVSSSKGGFGGWSQCARSWEDFFGT